MTEMQLHRGQEVHARANWGVADGLKRTAASRVLTKWSLRPPKGGRVATFWDGRGSHSGDVGGEEVGRCGTWGPLS